MKESSPSSERLCGIDSIRFLCALWVFCYHYSPPIEIGGHGGLGLIARGVLGNLWCGPAAVIVFFVISGFCIHHPYAAAAYWPGLRAFYARRFLRLLPPMLVAMLMGWASGVSMGFMNVSILWSLLAEFIYYLLYPALLALRLRLGGWRGLVIATYAAALGVVLTNPAAPDYPSFGPGLNWLLGLPCWLLGCMLAESVNARGLDHGSRNGVWRWRGFILLLGVGCSVLRFHAGIGYPWSLNVFALPATVWLHREIIYHRAVAAVPWLEWAGRWSYSFYLVHGPAAALFLLLFSAYFSSLLLQWLLMACFVLGGACLFYFLVERPSHDLARRAARRLRPPSAVDAGT